MLKSRIISAVAASTLLLLSLPAEAQQIRYAWLDLSFMNQDVDRSGVQAPLPDQTVEVNVSDGSGVRFRGSVGTWHNLYLWLDYGSTDIDLDALITNSSGEFPARDEFDYTNTQGGVGLKISLGYRTDLIAEVGYESVNLDFGSLAGENFDMEGQDVGGSIGLRTMLGDNFELRGRVRYSSVGNADLNTLEFEDDTLFGAGFSWQLVRGLHLVGDVESGEVTSVSLGFRVDLDED